ncbi:MAG: response regulator [Ktedonobacteraceae bacterium]|nr:response regulator [Ktedonobacteraceae bacterium]
MSGKEQREKTILIVEDDEDLGALILEALQQESFYMGVRYRTLLAIDGMEALGIIEETFPDLFLLDYYLPRINGLDLYDRMHAMETLSQVPTIFMSANPPFKELRKRNLLSIRKPFNLRELLDTIENALAVQKKDGD